MKTLYSKDFTDVDTLQGIISEVVIKTKNSEEFEVIIVTSICEIHSPMYLLPKSFPNVTYTM